MVEELEAAAAAGDARTPGEGVGLEDAEKAEMEQSLQELQAAVAEREARVEELEAVRADMQESYEMRIEEKEEAMQELAKEQELYASELKAQIDNLKLSVADQKDKGAGAQKAAEAEYQRRKAELEEQTQK